MLYAYVYIHINIWIENGWCLLCIIIILLCCRKYGNMLHFHHHYHHDQISFGDAILNKVKAKNRKNKVATTVTVIHAPPPTIQSNINSAKVIRKSYNMCFYVINVARWKFTTTSIRSHRAIVFVRASMCVLCIYGRVNECIVYNSWDHYCVLKSKCCYLVAAESL